MRVCAAGPEDFPAIGISDLASNGSQHSHHSLNKLESHNGRRNHNPGVWSSSIQFHLVLAQRGFWDFPSVSRIRSLRSAPIEHS